MVIIPAAEIREDEGPRDTSWHGNTDPVLRRVTAARPFFSFLLSLMHTFFFFFFFLPYWPEYKTVIFVLK